MQSLMLLLITCQAIFNSVLVGVDPRGAPCAYLHDFGRRDVKVLYRLKDGSFHTTTSTEGKPGESVHWAVPHPDGRPAMAFARDYKNLESLCVRGTAATRPYGHPGMNRGELDAWLAKHPVQSGSLEYSNSHCKRCRTLGSKLERDKKVPHNRSLTDCILSGISTKNHGDGKLY